MHSFTKSNKSYIGVTEFTVSKRLHKHYINMLSGLDTHFYRAMRLYGIEDVRTIVLWSETCSKKEAYEKEVYFIDKYNTFKNGYNMTPGGTGGWIIPEEKYKEWKNKLGHPGAKNTKFCGYTDDEILDKAYEYYTKDPTKFSGSAWAKYSHKKYNMPLSYQSKFRFSQYEGSGFSRFYQAMNKKFNLCLNTRLGSKPNIKYYKDMIIEQEVKEELKTLTYKEIAHKHNVSLHSVISYVNKLGLNKNAKN